jgi:hypothetical protein
MYRPWSFRLARRARESCSLRPRRVRLARPRAGESSTGPSRARARAIDARDLRIARISRLTDIRCLAKHASIANTSWANRTMDTHRGGRRIRTRGG